MAARIFREEGCGLRKACQEGEFEELCIGLVEGLFVFMVRTYVVTYKKLASMIKLKVCVGRELKNRP